MQPRNTNAPGSEFRRSEGSGKATTGTVTRRPEESVPGLMHVSEIVAASTDPFFAEIARRISGRAA